MWPAARLVRMLWRPGIRGVTLWRLVLADPEVMRGDPKSLGRLVIHEMAHVRQFAELGYVRFTVRYLTEYWRGRLHGKSHRDAYLSIGAEVEARALTERLT